MQGLCAVADRRGTEADVFEETQDFLAILSGNILVRGKILVADLADGLAVVADSKVRLEVLFARHSHHQAACDVLGETHDLIREARDVLLADICQQQVDLVVARLGLAALAGAGDAAGEERLIEVRHFNKLVLDVAGLLCTVVLSGERSRSNDHIAHANLAAAVALAVVAGKSLDHHTGKIILAVEEDVLVGDKHMVEHDQRFLTAELGVADVDGAALELAGVAALAAIDHVKALGVGGAGKGDGPILVRLAHGDGGHKDVPVRVDRAGLVDLRAVDDDAVRVTLDHAQEEVGILLVVGSLGAVALGVGHGAVYGEILILHHDQELLEILVVVRAVLLVDLVGGGVDGVEGVHADAALEAAGRFLTEQALHLDLFDKVVGGLMQVGETVDLAASEIGRRGHQVLILRVLRERIGHGDAVDAGADDRVIDPVVDLFAEHINAGVELAQRIDIFLGGHHGVILLKQCDEVRLFIKIA